MASITDLPFRRVVAGFGVGWMVSEMIASREMVTERPATLARAEMDGDDGRTIVQLAGRDPHWMAEAARMVADGGACAIDINMGCPAKTVTGGASGAALMREPGRALRLVAAVVGATALPVSVKMRLGWDDTNRNAAALAASAVDAGAYRITVHGRTRCQFYKGRADWAAIAPVVRAVPVPVMANGDIVDAASARLALTRSGAAGVMVGRGVQGRPWLPAQIAAELTGRPVPAAPTGAVFADIVARHYEAMLGFYGRAVGMKNARKHLGWYMDVAGTPARLRREVLVESDPERVIAHLPAALADGMPTAGAAGAAGEVVA